MEQRWLLVVFMGLILVAPAYVMVEKATEILCQAGSTCVPKCDGQDPTCIQDHCRPLHQPDYIPCYTLMSNSRYQEPMPYKMLA